jgi:hypothetical protein
VTRDNKGEVETVRYDAVNAMLLNEFIKEHLKVKEQGAIIALTAGLRKGAPSLKRANVRRKWSTTISKAAGQLGGLLMKIDIDAQRQARACNLSSPAHPTPKSAGVDAPKRAPVSGAYREERQLCPSAIR